MAELPVSRSDCPTLKGLCKYFILVAPNWFEIGLELLDAKCEKRLKIIEMNYKSEGAIVCCREMFSQWIDTKRDASWDQLIEALYALELNEAACTIEKAFSQGE